MASVDALIKVDTSQIDKATEKVERLLALIEKLYDLSKKSWLIDFILRVKK